LLRQVKLHKEHKIARFELAIQYPPCFIVCQVILPVIYVSMAANSKVQSIAIALITLLITDLDPNF